MHRHDIISAPTVLPSGLIISEVAGVATLILGGDGRRGQLASGFLRFRKWNLPLNHPNCVPIEVTSTGEVMFPNEENAYHRTSLLDAAANGLGGNIESLIETSDSALKTMKRATPKNTYLGYVEGKLSLFHQGRIPGSGLTGVEYQYVSYDLLKDTIEVFWRENGIHYEDLGRAQNCQDWLDWYTERETQIQETSHSQKYFNNKTTVISAVLNSRDGKDSYFGGRVAELIDLSRYIQHLDSFEHQRQIQFTLEHISHQLLNGEGKIVTDFDLSMRSFTDRFVKSREDNANQHEQGDQKPE